VGQAVENLGFRMRGVCEVIIDMGIGSCVRATAGSPQELEFGARSALKF
jgi:hypothetical protein